MKKNKFHKEKCVFIDTFGLERFGFCDGCSACTCESDIGEWSCPVGYDMLDTSCLRYNDIEEIAEDIVKLDERLYDVCRDNRRLAERHDDV